MTADALVNLLVEISWRSLIVSLFVGGALVLWRVRSGAARHAAWTVVMVVMLLMPGLLAVAPEVSVPGLPSFATQIAPASEHTAADIFAPPVSTAPGRRPIAASASAPPVQAGVRSTPETGTPSPAPWQPADWIISAWVIGVLLQAAWLFAGWRVSRKLAQTGRVSAVDPQVHESAAVLSPCAIGLWRGRILVPASWRLWSRDRRDTVVRHERTHLTRRDPLVSFVARVNRAVFWFHPLAWWLERRIAATAEQACDEAVLRAGQDPRQYATLLVELAAALRLESGRVAWHSIGMAGGRQLGQRVDRVLTGEVPRTTRARRIGATATVLAGITFAIACQQAPPPLQEDPVVAENIRRNQERTAEFEAAKAMSLPEATDLAKRFAQDPNDLAAARRLLTFYRDRGPELMGWNEMVPARRAVLLSLIERHPEASESYWPITRRLDPEGHERARAAWLAHTAKPDVAPRVLGNAAFFFRAWEPEIAERLLQQAEATDPGGPTPRVVNGVASTGWRARLGELYGYWIVGATEENRYNTIQTVNAERAASPFAVHARRTLDTTTDPKLLGPAGLVLFHSVPWVPEQRQQVLPFDPLALGRSYTERAVAADSSLVHLQRNIEQFDRLIAGRAIQARAQKLLGGQSGSVASLESIAGLPADLRLHLLPGMADMAFNSGEMREYYQKDTAGRDEHFRRARALADQALALAADMPADPRAPGLRYTAHLVIGVVSLREGDRKRAVTELAAAADAAESSTVPLDDVAMMSSQKLPQYLLSHGERESVAAFYERAAPHVPRNTGSWTKAAAAIRAGTMPESYQYARARR